VESPDAKGEIQKGLGIPINLYSGLSTGTIFGNAFFSLSGRPFIKIVL
jgi:hypothetical protein